MVLGRDGLFTSTVTTLPYGALSAAQVTQPMSVFSVGQGLV
jgi:hypothetical protein